MIDPRGCRVPGDKLLHYVSWGARIDLNEDCSQEPNILYGLSWPGDFGSGNLRGYERRVKGQGFTDLRIDNGNGFGLFPS
jgi:hypothetical protein